MRPKDYNESGTSQTTLRNSQYRPDRQERHALDQSRQASRRILLYVRQFRPIGFFGIYRVRRSKASVHLSHEVRNVRAGQLRILLLRVRRRGLSLADQKTEEISLGHVLGPHAIPDGLCRFGRDQQDKYLRFGRSDTVAFHIDLRRIRTLFPEQDLLERFQENLPGQDLHRVHDKGRDSQKFPKRRQIAGSQNMQRIRHKVVHQKERHRG